MKFVELDFMSWCKLATSIRLKCTGDTGALWVEDLPSICQALGSTQIAHAHMHTHKHALMCTHTYTPSHYNAKKLLIVIWKFYINLTISRTYHWIITFWTAYRQCELHAYFISIFKNNHTRVTITLHSI